MVQIGRFKAQFIGLHHEGLKEARQRHDANYIECRVNHNAGDNVPGARADKSNCQQHARERGDSGHHPERRSRDMRCGISSPMDHAECRIDKLIVVENEAPAEVSHENEQKNYKVPPSAVWHRELSARLRLPDSEDRANGENRKRSHGQHSNASLQQFIEWEAENIEAQVNTKEWIRDPKRAAVRGNGERCPIGRKRSMQRSVREPQLQNQ